MYTNEFEFIMGKHGLKCKLSYKLYKKFPLKVLGHSYGCLGVDSRLQAKRPNEKED